MSQDQLLDGYGRAVRGRATDSITELRYSMNHAPPSVSVRTRTVSPDDANLHEDHTYGAAVSNLTTLLRKHEAGVQNKTVHFSSRNEAHTKNQDLLHDLTAQASGLVGELPSPAECVQLLKNQSYLVMQMETENNYFGTELSNLKRRLSEVIAENHLLHDELRCATISTMIDRSQHVPTCTQEKLTVLHTAKSSCQDTNLHNAKKLLAEEAKELTEAKSQWQKSEACLPSSSVERTSLSGLCMQCATISAVLPPQNLPQKHVDELRRECDNLRVDIGLLRAKMAGSAQKEAEAYQQVKASAALVEQAQLEAMQSTLLREQAREEVENIRQCMAKEIQVLTMRVTQEKNEVRQEARAEVEQLNEKLKGMTAVLSNVQVQLERATRDKVSLQSELYATRTNASDADFDYGKATDNMKMSMTQACLERNAAMQELKELKQQLKLSCIERTREQSQLKTELQHVRRRLDLTETQLEEAKEKNMLFTEQLNETEKRAHMAVLSKENMEKSHSDYLKAVELQARQHEHQQSAQLETAVFHHAEVKSGLEGLVNSQSTLVSHLKDECRRTTRRLEDVTTRHKSEKLSLQQEIELIGDRLAKTLARQHELEEQASRAAEAQDKMRKRLRQMDKHAQHCATQILDQLTRESALLRDRQTLVGEVDFLRHQMETSDIVTKVFKSRVESLDDLDILKSINLETREESFKS